MGLKEFVDILDEFTDDLKRFAQCLVNTDDEDLYNVNKNIWDLIEPFDLLWGEIKNTQTFLQNLLDIEQFFEVSNQNCQVDDKKTAYETIHSKICKIAEIYSRTIYGVYIYPWVIQTDRKGTAWTHYSIPGIHILLPDMVGVIVFHKSIFNKINEQMELIFDESPSDELFRMFDILSAFEKAVLDKKFQDID